MRGRTAASTAAVLLFGAVLGGLTVRLGGTTGAVLWGVGVVVALLAGFAARRPAQVRDAPVDLTKADKVETGNGDAADGAGRRVLVVASCLALVAGLVAFWPDDDTERRPSAGSRPHSDASSPSPTGSGSGSGSGSVKGSLAWKVPAVGGDRDRGPGAWGLRDTVVQGRLAGLFAYGARAGAVRWSLPAPARVAVCGMSPRAEEGVGLVAYGRHDKPCATLAAVRTSDGKTLWQRTVAGDGLAAYGFTVGGATAVAVEDRTVRARSAETGAQRWQRPLAKNCEIRAVEATASRTLLVEQCGSGARLLALDTRTGTEQWKRDLPIESEATAAVISVTPVVVAVAEEDERGTSAFLGFDDRGAPTVTVPLSGPAGKLVAPAAVAGTSDDGRALVLGDLLITLAERKDLVPDVVVAHSLKDGRKVWERGFTHQTSALTGEPDGRVGVLLNAGDGAKIALLDTARGTVSAQIDSENVGAALSITPEPIAFPDGHVVVNHISLHGEPAVFGLR
ncbi:PQQ-binding-like beta-propeller repeat protein [Streptomyces sp. ISL-36]|uniref:outer membrane protein assembly factor BamB family protein n=1 Tax=Streptomyces sp. ISL-36 TaxID=2819182 RepID=UPI001BE86BE5|nr:PQQ-binding-like beta-propeller repeat protein [Streptomyces sp. ISL-36]MBT2440269.1 PQQ-binding-like beta-propeller repeat protein [Streptomyces sp. ISL-36]